MSTPPSPTTPPSYSPTWNDFNILQIEKTSPPRFQIHGADSDEEEAEKELEQEVLQEFKLLKKIDNIYLEVFFKNPLHPKRAPTIFTMNCANASWDIDQYTLTCQFIPQSSDPVLFSLNHQGRYSKTRVMTGSPENKKLIREFTQYIVAPEKNAFSSLNARFKGSFKLLSKHEADKTFPKPGCVRNLFETPVKAYEVHIDEGATRLGGIVALQTAQVQLKLDIDM